MAKKKSPYRSPLTKDITRDNWKEVLMPKLKSMTVDEIMALRYDMGEMEKLGKQLSGLLKEILIARLGDSMEYESDTIGLALSRVVQYRAGGLDRDRILEDMGQNFVDNYTKDGTEYEVMTIKPLSRS